MDLSLIFRDEQVLDFGGSVRHEDLKDLPSDFVATQSFRARKGKVRATISAVGPTEEHKGGIFFFGHLGLNPFFDEEGVGDLLELAEFREESNDIGIWKYKIPAKTEIEFRSSWWTNIKAYFSLQKLWNLWGEG
jgi:hypothetical protein